MEIPKRGIIGRALELRIVHHQLQACIASRCSKDGGCLEQPIGHRVSEVGALHSFHCRLDRSWVEEVALDDFRTLLAEFVGPGIEFMDEGANGDALLAQETRDETSG